MKLAEFAAAMIRDACFDGHDLDGGWVQEQAERFGLIKMVKYDPTIHGEADGVEKGDPWYVFSPALKRILAKEKAAR